MYCKIVLYFGASEMYCKNLKNWYCSIKVYVQGLAKMLECSNVQMF